MKGLKIIPMVLVLIVLTYFGIGFVEQNRDEVVVTLGTHQSPPTPVGFVVLTSIFGGMVVCGGLCSIELMALYMQNRKLKRRVPSPSPKKEIATASPSDVVAPRTSGRFT